MVRFVHRAEVAGIPADLRHPDQIGVQVAVEDVVEGDGFAAIRGIARLVADRLGVRDVLSDDPQARALGAHPGSRDLDCVDQIHRDSPVSLRRRQPWP
jgi:hypothetical protein